MSLAVSALSSGSNELRWIRVLTNGLVVFGRIRTVAGLVDDIWTEVPRQYSDPVRRREIVDEKLQLVDISPG